MYRINNNAKNLSTAKSTEIELAMKSDTPIF